MTTDERTSDLFAAADVQTSVVERRSAKRRVRRDRRKGIQRSVGLEISPSGVALAIIERCSESGKNTLIVNRSPFPSDSGPARGDWSDGTLRETLAELSAEHQLSGQAVLVSLGGAPCMTRVVVGQNDTVDGEVAELKERTDRYIGMGRGEKVSCDLTTRIDAKRKRAWVTVALRNVVDEIAVAVRRAGLRMVRMEHTMPVLCRILQEHAQDTNEPVLLIVDELGRLDIGISYQGKLLLDYRPAMPDKTVSQGSIIQRHIKCLRRYICSQMPNVDASLSRIYVTGSKETRSSLYGIDEQRELQSHPFPIEEMCDGLDVRGELSEDAGLLAAISLSQQSKQETLEATRNDLMSTLRTTRRIPWLKLARQAWPIAASVLFGLSMLLFANHHQKKASLVENKIESLSAANAEVRRMRFVLNQHEQKSKQVDRIASRIGRSNWTQVVWKTGSILPSNTWLDSVEINRTGTLRLSGGSFTDKAIYQYIDRLKKTEIFSSVALDATNVSRVGNKQTYRFEVSAKLIFEVSEKRDSANRVNSDTFAATLSPEGSDTSSGRKHRG